MKKKEKREAYLRARDVISADKSILSEGCKALVERDFACLFEEYFVLTSPPKLDIDCNDEGYEVTIRFEANRIKKFNVLK